MVTAVVGHHHELQVAALRQSHGHAEHDAVAEGHHRRLHVLVGIVAVGNGIVAAEQRAIEILSHKLQGDDQVLDAQPLAMQGCKGQFAAVVVGAVVKRHSQRDTFQVVV